jgi:phosphotransferase system enzyme I (PtsP)
MRRQLRALLLAAAGRELSVMFPMVATLAEFRAARALLLAEAERVRPRPRELRIGTMLEVPSLLWQFDALLAETDFVSIGTNDLMQFLYAADRTSPALAARYDLLSPAMLMLIADVARRARAAGVALSVCGEAAGRPIEALSLIGLGVTSLSMPAPAVLPLKAALGALDINDFSAFLTVLCERDSCAGSLRGVIGEWLLKRNVPV